MGRYRRDVDARYQVVSVRVSDAEMKALDDRRSRRQSRSEVVRAALLLLLAKEGNA